MVRFEKEIVRVNLRAKLDFLDLVGVLVLPGFLVLLGLFVTELAEIDEAADGRGGRGSDFDEIHTAGAGEIESVAERKDAQLLVVNPDNPHFAGTNLAVYPEERSGGRRPWGKGATQDTPVR